MSEEKGYNGWSNYETWVVKLWIDNEQPHYETVTDQVQAIWAGAGERDEDSSPTLSREQRARYDLADWLKGWVHEAFELPTEGLAADLVGATLSEVNWDEMAQSFLEDEREQQAS